MGNVRRTHERLDAATAAAMDRLYQSTIEFDGHPNQVGVGGSVVIDVSGPVAWLRVGFLTPGTLPAFLALKTAVEVTIGAC